MIEQNTQTAAVEDDPIEVRKAKRAALIEQGVDPYGHAFSYTHHIGQLNELYAHLEDGASTEDAVDIAGRIMAKRVQGKIAFLELQDATDTIQLFCRINALGEDAFAALKDLDVGDWIGVHGTMMRTKRGQLSVAVESFELLSKSLRPLPEKFHGLTDKETRYRQRYVDLVVNPEVRSVFAKRFKIVSAIRRYMEDQGFYEVETPFLHPIIGGANAKPFVTHFNALDRDYYLRIATELPLKRLLVGGFEKVFEIGRIFRNEGMDPYHNPEFTTIEAYQAFTDLRGMMELTQGFIQAAAQAACGTLQITYQGVGIDLSGEWRVASMIELATEGAGEDVSFERTREELVAILERNGGRAEDAWGKGKLIAEIFEAVAEEKLVQPTFVIDHPLEVSPLAKKKADNPELTERFELFICGHEYANAFTELNDPVDQAERFRAQVEAKGMGDDEAMGFDHDYIRALEYGMPPAGGVGLGIDRLVMLLADAPTIRDVLLFPHMRDEQDTPSRAQEQCLLRSASQCSKSNSPLDCSIPHMKDETPGNVGWKQQDAPSRVPEQCATSQRACCVPHMRDEQDTPLRAQGSVAAETAEASTASSSADDLSVAVASTSVYAPNKVPTIDFSNVVVDPLFEDEVDFETFSKSDFRAVKVKACEAVPKSKKLLKFTLDDGTEEDRIILSGIHAYYEPEELVGRTLIAITNLPPRKMMGIYSCGMIISAVHSEAVVDGEPEERLNLLMADDRIPAGAKLY